MRRGSGRGKGEKEEGLEVGGTREIYRASIRCVMGPNVTVPRRKIAYPQPALELLRSWQGNLYGIYQGVDRGAESIKKLPRS